MKLHELDKYRLSDAIKFNDTLNPQLWGDDEHLRPEVRTKLLAIAEDFASFLGVNDINIKDITVSGSNAAYSYTPHSDIDLHLVVDLPQADISEVYRELFDAKKYQYNDQHNYTIGDYDVELYVQNANEEHHSQGIYSLLAQDWVRVPNRRQPTVDDVSVKSKYEDLGHRIETAIKGGNEERLRAIADKIKSVRQSGLETTGEYGAENLAFKLLRNTGMIEKLYTAMTQAKDKRMSLEEKRKKKKPFKYGFGDWVMQASGGGGYSTGDAGVEEAVEEKSAQDLIRDFVKDASKKLGLENIPKLRIKKDPQWSKSNGTFGHYDLNSGELTVSIADRHIVDILRTVAHELVHRRQDEISELPDHAGETGSKWENQANAIAGELMRNYAKQYPEHFKVDISEAGGYIPVNKKEARDPRYSMAMTVDIKTGETQKQARKMGFVTDPAGVPPTLKTSGKI